MRSFLLACVAALIVAIAAAAVLDRYQRPAESAYKTISVRI